MQDEVQLSSQQAALIARALYALSHIDGHEEREGMLIQSFWLDAVGPSAMHELQAFARETHFDPELLVKGLPGAEQREVFVRTALMLCYADGKMSDNEKKWLWDVGARLGFSAETLEGHDAAIRSYLLGQLAHVQNVDALREVAKELGLG
jgi:hypothetical protein